MTDTSAAESASSSAPSARPPRPRIVDIACGLLGLSAVAVVLAALSLFGVPDWLMTNLTTAYNKALKANPKANVVKPTADYVHQIAVSQTIVAVILAVMVLGIAWMARTGRPFARWAAVLLYVLSFLTGTLLSYTSIISVGASEPLIFKIPSFLAGAAFLAGVVVLNLRPSVEWLNWGRPAPVARAGGRSGGGLFGPRAGGSTARTAARAPRPGGAGPRPGGLLGRLMQPPPDPRTMDVDPVSVETTDDTSPAQSDGASAASGRQGKAKGGGARSTAKSRRS